MMKKLALLLFACASAGCTSGFVQRPYRFEITQPPATATQLVGERMRRDAETVPVVVDPSRGVVFSPWKIVGVSASLRLLPPGEDRYWIIERWRVVVVPFGWMSSVLVDVERVLCDQNGFQWDAHNLWGRCRVETTTTESGQGRIDGKGTQIATMSP
jgi:hypothetical protein